jgi:hypothetical protein
MYGALADYVCAGLNRRPASMATDPTLKALTRKFAIADQGNGTLGDIIQQRLQQACGISPPVFLIGSPAQQTSAVAELKSGNYTTVIGNDDNLLAAAEKGQYHPEWLFAGGSLDGQYNERRSDQDEWISAYGITPRWRWRPNPGPYWYQAALSVDPAASPDTWFGSSIYYGLLEAFTAIQLAGPDLTPQNVQNGLEAFTADYAPPFSPHASYAAGDHSFVDDFMIARWDPTGTPPGGATGSGCLRLALGGQRFAAGGQWPGYDVAAATDSSQPCQADEIDQTGGTLDQPQ